MNLFNIQHFSLHDGPGIRTTVFFKGCPLNCAWCHNPESKESREELSFDRQNCVNCQACANACETGVHSFSESRHEIDRTKCIGCQKCVAICPTASLSWIGKEYSCEEVLQEIEKDDVFFGTDGGVTVSGGEPFAQFEALLELLVACKHRGYSTCIETSGATTPERIREVAKNTDLFLYDCKETDPKCHLQYVGCDNAQILQNLSVLDEVGANVILRCPIVQGVNDRTGHYEAIAELANRHASIQRIEVMPYHPIGIAKNERIGKTCLHGDMNFLPEQISEECRKTIAMHTQKLVIVSTSS